MYFEDATKKQLIQIALFEDCSLEHKYEAARELQLRQWNEREMLHDLIRLWGKGLTPFEIAIELGIEEYTVRNKLKQYGLWKRRVGA